MNLTKQEAIRLHREMWRRISELSDEEIKRFHDVADVKKRILKSMNITEPIKNSCFCCEYADIDCYRCPIVWKITKKCFNRDSLYLRFEMSRITKNFDEFRRLAKEISELPEREDNTK